MHKMIIYFCLLLFKNFASKMLASDLIYFADFEQVKIVNDHFTNFEQVKILVVILLTLNKSKILVINLLTLNK